MMSIQIEVQESHVQPLIDFYVSRLRVLRDEIQEREQETKNINSVIQTLKRKITIDRLEKPVPVITNYSEKWPWVKKVQFAIEFKNKPLTTRDIVETLIEFEPSFLIDRKRVVASISSILSSKSGEDKDFLRLDSESGDFAYIINNQKDTQVEVYEQVQHDDEDGLPF